MAAKTRHDDMLGAVGLPIGILAAVVAAIPLAGIYFFWLPGAAAIALGSVGMVQARRRSSDRHLSIAALVLGLASFAITGVWLLLGLLLRSAMGAEYTG